MLKCQGNGIYGSTWEISMKRVAYQFRPYGSLAQFFRRDLEGGIPAAGLSWNKKCISEVWAGNRIILHNTEQEAWKSGHNLAGTRICPAEKRGTAIGVIDPYIGWPRNNCIYTIKYLFLSWNIYNMFEASLLTENISKHLLRPDILRKSFRHG